MDKAQLVERYGQEVGLPGKFQAAVLPESDRQGMCGFVQSSGRLTIVFPGIKQYSAMLGTLEMIASRATPDSEGVMKNGEAVIYLPTAAFERCFGPVEQASPGNE